MKFTNLFAFLVFCAVLPFYSCGSDSSEAGNSDTSGTTEAAPVPNSESAQLPGAISTDPAAPGALQAPGADATAAKPATPPSGVKHYTCPKNCKGSGGDAAGNCPVCGTAYVHNQAFHGAAPSATPGASPTPGATATPITTPPPPSPAKNAAGVFHYTCAKGCAGGSGAAGKCASCGGELAHNAAYHNN